MVNSNFFIHLTTLNSQELCVNYQAVCLLHVMLAFEESLLNVTLKTLAKIMYCSEIEIKSSLNFIQKCDLITWNICQSPENLLLGQVIVNFNRKKIDRISLDSWSQSKPKSTRIGSIYLIESPATGLVKIGRSQNVKRRLQTLSTSCAENLKLLLTIESNDVVQLEKTLHQRFNYCRVNREWFRLTEREMHYISQFKERLQKPVAIKKINDPAPNLPF